MRNLINIDNFSRDYINSSNLRKLDRGIRETIRGIQISALAVGCVLLKMQEDGSYLDLNFTSFTAYLDDIIDGTKFKRSTIYNWIKIGRIYISHKDDLKAIGYDFKEGTTKLLYLEDALSNGDKNEVLQNFKDMPLREFMAYAKENKEKKEPEDFPFWELTGSIFMNEGKRAVILNTELEEYSYNMLMGLNTAGFKALENSQSILVVYLKNMRELNRFKKIARIARAEMREEMRKERLEKKKKRGGRKK